MKNPPFNRRPAAATQRQGVSLGLGWYTADTWAQVKAAATDPDRFEASFADWEVMATETLAKFRSAGLDPVKCLIVPADLLAWCLVHNQPNNAASRAKFVSAKMRERHASGA